MLMRKLSYFATFLAVSFLFVFTGVPQATDAGRGSPAPDRVSARQKLAEAVAHPLVPKVGRDEFIQLQLVVPEAFDRTQAPARAEDALVRIKNCTVS